MKVSRKIWLGLLAGVAAVTAMTSQASAQQQQKPNILFIMGDDIGWMQPRIYHRGLMVGETPNIDRIGNEGAIFMTYYAEQSCTSGRAAAHVWLVFAGFILFNLAMNAGPNATTFALAPELFPTSIRASAGGFAAAAAKVGATLGIFVLPQIKAHGGVAAVLVMMAIVRGLGAAVTAILAREVGEIPEGRSMDEAEAL
jgi:hypothetical protein